MEFKKGTAYTRQEIREIVGGGSVQNAMPIKDGRVLCVCLSQPWDIDAPRVVLVGAGPSVQKEAEMFCSQNTAVPFFYKKTANLWEYVGDFKPERWSDDPGDVRGFAQSSGRINLTKVIFLHEAAS
ncbi:MAG: hypothetical protein WC547_10705 [Candidatus Omnitrophota bacterium]